MDDLLVQKWEETGLLEGLVGEDKVVTAKGFEVLFEYLMDDFFPKRDNQRFWEDLGAFHFSIGLF